MKRAERGGKGASAGSWRRADELRGMPGANNERDLLKEDRTAQLDKDDNDSCGRCHGCGGVQDDAEGAMVGVAGVLVDVHDLGESQQQEEQQTQHRDRDGECARPSGLVPAWLEWDQPSVPFLLRIHRLGCPVEREVSIH